ncbi:MAG: DsbA family protein [Patescibacteria group bacterium]|jgi:protein-disulfide isomerase
MSIHTNALPETSKFREQSKLRPTDVTPPQKSTDAVELELSLPMLVILVLAVGIVGYGLFTFFGKKSSDNTPKTPPDTLEQGLVDVTVSTSYLTIEKKEGAKYMFVEFSDFECPYCKLFTSGYGDGKPSSFDQITKKYIDSGIMQFAYAPYIAVASHKPAATNETLAFYCAAEQGKAFDYHKKIFELTSGNGLGIDNKGSEESSLINIAKDLGLNTSDFTTCLQKRDFVAIDRVQEQINKEIKTPWGDKFGAQNFGTPAFAVCKLAADNPTTCVGKAYVGAWPYADMEKVIDNYLGADAPKTN